ncbi:MAG: hypothetical protein ACI8X5_002085 [Planctomycetota bacterium]|jgi:hypothetical protein
MQPIDLLLAHAAATWALVGLIWMVQIVQYPGFAHVGATEFANFHEQHLSRITWIVAFLMGAELLTGLALLLDRPAGVSTASLWFGMGLIGVNWACTAFVSVPLHARLTKLDRTAQSALVRTNWLRTIAWTLRGAWILFALRAALAA